MVPMGKNSHRLASGAEEQAALWAARLGALEQCASHRYAELFGLQGGGDDGMILDIFPLSHMGMGQYL